MQLPQLLNTLQLNKKEVGKLLKPSMDYVKLLKTDLRVFRKHINSNKYKDGEINSTEDFILMMLSYTDKFAKTDMFMDYRRDIVNNWINNLKQGHILVHGTYATLLGNPYEMLCSACKGVEVKHPLLGNNIHCSFFNEGNLLAERNPSITMGNLWLCNNIKSELIDKYFNLTDYIVCVNSINNNVLNTLSGSDFDSDTVLLTDNNMLLQSASKNYNKFLVPTCNIKSVKTKRKNTPADCHQKRTAGSYSPATKGHNCRSAINIIPRCS